VEFESEKLSNEPNLEIPKQSLKKKSLIKKTHFFKVLSRARAIAQTASYAKALSRYPPSFSIESDFKLFIFS
jgi:hypothetical protein